MCFADEKVADTFGQTNTIALLVPRGDYEKEGQVLRQVGALHHITSATGLANIEVEDGTYLTDQLTPRQFAELAGVDVELARLLYQAYGLSNEEYGAIFQDVDQYTAPLVDVFEFLLEQKDKGVVSLSGEQAREVEDLQETLDAGLKQLRGEHWSRLVFVADLPQEGEETYALLDQIRSIAKAHYGDDVVLVGNSTNAFDLSSSFSGDNLKISILTALFVMVILLFTFKSAGLPILLVLTIQLFKKLGGRSRKFYQQQQAALGDVNGNIQEMIEGLKVVKAFTHEEQAKEQFQGLNETYRDAATNASFYSTAVMPISMNIMNVGYALTAAFGGVLSLLAGFKLGSFTLYLGYCRQVGQPLSQISQQLTTILSALAGAERIFDAMDAQPEEDQGVVTLVPAEKDANGTLSAHTGSGHPHTWAWKTPRTAAMSLGL